MTDIERFVKRWVAAEGSETRDSHNFWFELLQDVVGIEKPTRILSFESNINGRRADVWARDCSVLIEQKSRGVDLDKPEPRHGTMETPYEQAKWYFDHIKPRSDKPRWLITCNFDEFRVYDMDEDTTGKIYKTYYLNQINKFIPFLGCFKDKYKARVKREEAVSFEAGQLVGKLYDALSTCYVDIKNDAHEARSLNMLITRLVFLMFAEDAGILSDADEDLFTQYVERHSADELRDALLRLFEVLDMPVSQRKYVSNELNQFPYVNGGLFREKAEIPMFTEKVKAMLLKVAAFDWSQISPTIFGAIFESTLNPETRHAGGMHYTSVQNIHKVIDPLFLDALTAELDEIETIENINERARALVMYRSRLQKIYIFDPACGSGNFLTESYMALRKLENRVIHIGGMDMSRILVRPDNFYGIEINDFAADVAKTALWIAEIQMRQETKSLLLRVLESDLPLQSTGHIITGNSLSVDWLSLSDEPFTYIIGNPPFLGTRLMNDQQTNDIRSIYVDEKGKPYKTAGKNDYVAGWFFKAAAYMHEHPSCMTAFVSTNSVCQGEQVMATWKPLIDRFGIEFYFAHKSFAWKNEADNMAAVTVIVVGFGMPNQPFSKRLFDGDEEHFVSRINPYLMDAPTLFIDKRREPMCDVPHMAKGSQLIDGGHFMFETKGDRDAFVEMYPEAEPYVFPYCNADSFLNSRPAKYCLCLKDCPSHIIRNSKGIKKIVNAVKDYRNKSGKAYLMKLKPTDFYDTKVPSGKSIIIPIVSSEKRDYVPMGFSNDIVIYTNATGYVDNATIYHFGVMISSVHMAWMRTVCGRLKTDYRYSKDIVYNNFVWPEPTDMQRAKIEETAQHILDVRAKYPNDSLADLYDPDSMPADLRKAHAANDKAVMDAYGIKLKSEDEIVEFLFEKYTAFTTRKI